MSVQNTQNKILVQKAAVNIKDTVTIAIEHSTPARALVIYDTENELTEILTEAYRAVLPEATFIDFNSLTKEEIIAQIDTLSPKDLVVLIQSMDFRLNAFRFRIYLFQKKLKVIDHQHLYRNTPDSWETYIDALAYDSTWYRGTGHALKKILEDIDTLIIESGEHRLTVTDGLEIPKLNIGDYTGMDNIGGTFPIGEVFTEAKDLSKMNGSIMIYAFAGTDFHINMHEPFRIDIENGLLVGWSLNAPESFVAIVHQVRVQERPLIREIGFGLNRAITRERYLKDITAFERRLGMHLSLGEKHTVYKKQGITADKTRFHVDLFPMVDSVIADKVRIFSNEVFKV
jgi:hypothetical protein